jgi:hypothetical protein
MTYRRPELHNTVVCQMAVECPDGQWQYAPVASLEKDKGGSKSETNGRPPTSVCKDSEEVTRRAKLRDLPQMGSDAWGLVDLSMPFKVTHSY